MSKTTGFRFIEYSGEDAGDVLVSLLMNLAHPELAAGNGGEPEVHEIDSLVDGPRLIGFQPNSKDEGEEDEDE